MAPPWLAWGVLGEHPGYEVTGSNDGELDGLYEEGYRNEGYYRNVIAPNLTLFNPSNHTDILGQNMSDLYQKKWVIVDFSDSASGSDPKFTVKSYAATVSYTHLTLPTIYSV